MSIATPVQDSVVGDQKHMVCQPDCNGARPTLVIGIFSDHGAATRAVHDLHRSPSRCFRLLSQHVEIDRSPPRPAEVGPDEFLRRTLTIDEESTPLAPSSIRLTDGVAERRLASLKVYRQVAGELAAGSDVIVVHAHGPSQQFSASRILLQSHCDVLLTHDGNHGAE